MRNVKDSVKKEYLERRKINMEKSKSNNNKLRIKK